MPKAKLSPNALSYSAAISACEKGGQWQLALTLFMEMQKALSQIGQDDISYRAVVRFCVP